MLRAKADTPYNALAKGRFYLFFIRLVDFFVSVLCGVGKIRGVPNCCIFPFSFTELGSLWGWNSLFDNTNYWYL